MASDVRVRFAPSPTGYLHLGGARTALFNWLFARHEGGRFILRIEDTDRARSTEAAIEAIIRSMSWLGLSWDEGPYRQMDRLDLYRQRADRLMAEGKAYYCYCLPEELEERRRAALAEGRPPRYDRRCLHMSPYEGEQRRAEGRQPVARFFSPDEGTTVVHDLVRGDVSFDNAYLDDLIILRPDGIPTYNFAAVVDDLDMAVTHVIRGEDHLPNTPRQLQIYQALGAEPPAFAHLSMILGPDRSPLSKRHGATAVREYEEQGYLPEAMVNYLALLGWSYDEKTTLFTIPELIARFSLAGVTKSPAIFDIDKLRWMNGHYIRQLDVEELTDRLLPFWRRAGFIADEIDAGTRARLTEMAKICQERMETLADIVGLTDFFFRPVEYDPAAVDKVLKKEGAGQILVAAHHHLAELADFTTEAIEAGLRGLAEELGLKPGKVFQPIRVAVTGRTVSPPLFETLAILGRDESLARLKTAGRLCS